MAELGTIRFRLIGDTTQFKKSMKSAGVALKSMETELRSVALASGVAFAAVGLATKKVVDTYKDFQAGLSRAGAIAGATGEQLAVLEGNAISLAKTTPFTATQVTEAMNFMAMAGFNAKAQYDALPSVLQLATAGSIDLGKAADVVTGVMAGFGKSGEEMAKVNDTIAAAITGAKVDVSQLGETFRKAGPVAKALGITFEDLTAATMSLGNANIQGGLAGTGLARAMSILAAPVGKQKKLIKELGLDAAVSGGKITSLADIVKILGGQSDKTSEILTLFGSRAGPQMLALLEQGSGAMDKWAKRIAGAEGMAKSLSDVTMATLSGQLNTLNARVEGAAIKLGKELEPAISLVANAIGAMADSFADASPWVHKVAAGLLITAGVVSGLTAALATGSLMFLAYQAAMPGIIVGLKGMQAAMKKTAVAAARMLLPALPAIAAVAAGVIGVVLILGAIKQAWAVWGQDVKDIMSSVGSFIGEKWDDVKKSIQDKLKLISQGSVFVFSRMKGLIAGIIASIGARFEALTDLRFTDALIGGVDEFAAAMKDAADEGDAMIKEMESSSAGLWSDAGKNINDNILTPLGKVGGAIVDGVSEFGDFWVDSIGGPIKKTFMEGLSLFTGGAGLGLDLDILGASNQGGGAGGGGTPGGGGGGGGGAAQFDSIRVLDELIAGTHDPIRAYIADLERQNRDAFNRDAIEQKLLEKQDAAAEDNRLKIAGGVSQLVSSLGTLGPAFAKVIEGEFVEAAISGGVAILQQTELFKKASSALESFATALAAIIDAVDRLTGGIIGKAFDMIGGVADWFGDLIGTTKELTDHQRKLNIEKIKELNLIRGVSQEGRAERRLTGMALAGEELPDLTTEQIDELNSFIGEQIKELQDELLDVTLGLSQGDAEGLSEEIGRLQGALQEGADGLETTVDEMNDQLLNVPSGLKVALARFNAATGESGGAGAIPENVATGREIGQASQVFQIGEVILDSVNDPEAFAQELERRSQLARQATNGPMGGKGSIPGKHQGLGK